MSAQIIQAFGAEFRRYRKYVENSASQLPWTDLRISLDPDVNSIAVVMKHMACNLRSRWTDPFITDGEKSWRNRDNEFIDDFADRAALDACWAAGWQVLETALAGFADSDLGRTLMIRGEPHSLALALTRSLSHMGYHAGQITQTARVLASRTGVQWQTLTVPRGGSVDFNRRMGFDPAASRDTNSVQLKIPIDSTNR